MALTGAFLRKESLTTTVWKMNRSSQTAFLYAAYGWLGVGGVLHFSIDVVSQYLRGKRAPGPATSLYYGLNSAYALGQVLFALLALLAIRQGFPLLSRWSGLTLGFVAAASWLAIAVLFIEYPQPRIVIALFAALLVGAAVTA
jgi:hypothetical protein